MTRSAASILILAAVVACGEPPAEETGMAAAIDTVDGIERLRYDPPATRPLDWSVDTVAVLGDAFAEDAYQFNDVPEEGLAGTAEGSLLVLDRQGDRVLEYGPTGEHLTTFGREGAGPGELSQPLGLAVGPGDTAWVSDFDNARLTGYPLDGGDARVIPFPDNSGIPAPRMAVVEAGHLLEFRPLFNFRRRGSGFEMSRGDGSEPERPMLPVVRYGRDALEPKDTLWSSPEPPTDMVELQIGDRLMVTMTGREFYPDLLWDAFSDGGLVVSDSAAYLLRLIDADGTVRRLVARDPAPRATTEADREVARDRVRSQLSEGGGVRIGGGGPDESVREQMLQQRLEKMTFADLVPRIVALRVDPLDRVWVGVTEDVADEIARIDVYDRDGRLIGEVRGIPMPDVFLGNDRIGVLRRDELDVQQVVVLELDEGGGGEVARR